MPQIKIHRVLSLFIAFVWLINGLVCKVLDYAPRHRLIVAAILGERHSALLTVLIGFAEIAMAFWIISKIKQKLNAIIQLLIIGLMNILEFILVPHLLLWGRLNIVFALLFMILIYYNEAVLNKNAIH